MKKIIPTLLASLFAVSFTYAQTAAPASPTPATAMPPAPAQTAPAAAMPAASAETPAAAPQQAAAPAQSCEQRAIDKNGKPLAGAAKTAFMKKCERETQKEDPCEAKAIGKNGKPLAGAAKTAFMKKCQSQQ